MPVTPSKVQLSVGSRNQTITLINEGEVNLLKAAGLKELSFALLLPQVKYPFARYDGTFVGAETYLAYFEQCKAEKKPFQFLLSRCMPSGKLLFDTSLTVSLEDYTIAEDARNGFDLEVSVRLKEYRPFGAKMVDIETPAPTAPVVVEKRPAVESKPAGGSTTKKSAGRCYKVQIPGMGVVPVQATSAVEAITKAAGNNWKGTIYVDGVAYSGETKQPLPKVEEKTTVAEVVEKVTGEKPTVSRVVLEQKKIMMMR